MRKCRRVVLIASRDFSYPGGVVSVVSMLMNHFSDAIGLEHFRTGPRVFLNSRRLKFLFAIMDCFRLILRVLLKRYDAVCLNTSLNTKAIIRDAIFMTSLHAVGFKKTIVFIHGWDTVLAHKIQGNRLLRRCFRRLFFNVPIVIVLASQFKQNLIEIGLLADKIHVITTMFEAGPFESLEFNIKKAVPSNLLFLSRFQREKGTSETIEAFALICDRYPETRLVMAGDGPEREGLEDLVRKCGLTHRVTFTGYIRGAEKMKVLSEADIFVLPTYREGCPVSLLEAMAAGLGVITTRVGGIPDIVGHCENGILLEDIAPLSIANAIEKLIADPELLFTIRLNNRHKAFEQYEATQVARKVEKLFQRIIE